MKRVGYLYNNIIDKRNIKDAIIKSSNGKRYRRDVDRVYKNIDYYVDVIHDMLKEKSYIPSEYKISLIYDNLNKKERIISKPKYFPDQVIHYCLILILEPILIKKMYKYSCGSIPKRGTSFGQKNIRKWLDNDIKGTKYCLKMDIKKFYPSINKNIMKNKFEHIIKDKDCLWLINSIIDSNNDGIPLGNYTSGWFANFFLTDLDYFIKSVLKIKYYIRYVDDLVILDGSKRHLHQVLLKISNFLEGEKLILKKNYQVFKVDERGIDFLGYRFFRDKTILRKRNMYRISRKAKSIAKKIEVNYKDACSIIAYYGWIKHSDSYTFYKKRIKPYTKISKMKLIISNNDKIKNNDAITDYYNGINEYLN